MTHYNVNFMRLEIQLEAEKNFERKSKIPIETTGFYKKERMQVPRQWAGERPIEYFNMCQRERL